jgi:hypothetical protein
VNAYAYFIVNHHLDYLLEQASKRQRVDELFPRPSIRARIASTLAGVRRVFDPVELSGPALPNLEHYPYRG